MSASLARTTDRRKLLTTGLAAGLFAASGLSIAMRPRVGGRLRAALPGAAATDSWDARKGFGLFMAAAGQGAVFDALTEVGADGALKGELATGWQASADARLWVFDLRKEVRFHDGTVFDAQSVVESIQLHLDAGPSGAGWHLVSNIDAVRASGPYQVQFQLRSGNADFPYLLSDRHLIIYPAGKIAEAMRDGIGTGLYRVARFEPGKRLLGWRVADHYRDGSAGWFDQIEFLAAESAADRLALLQAGRVDAAAQIDPVSAQVIENDPGLKLSSIPGNQHLVMDARALPVDARHALKLGIDREAVLLDGLQGHGHLASDSPVGPFNQYYSTERAQFDPDRSLSLLKTAGLDGVGLGLTALNALPRALISAVAPALHRAGFRTGGDVRVPMALSAGRATEEWVFEALGSGDKTVSNLAELARSELDPTRRAALYSELQTVFRASGPLVIPVFANFLHATRTIVASPEMPGNLWPMDNARFAERWWMG
ncbi:MAG: ABC transporter substrate-binding protein [Paracoccaceae bacterium]|jgi:peptide/nickel transport system substrate-binding protein|nr:ABC transporter substrate-binding protein [Paracoccaceae bacterium]MDP7186196.1 ABC transporter substrate-binding protein [Paracoccaceae bacterium]